MTLALEDCDIRRVRFATGLLGLRFPGLELIWGDLKRFKGGLTRFEVETFRADAS